MSWISFSDVANLKTWQELRRWTSVALQTIRQELNGNITFQENIAAAGPYTLTFEGPGILQLRHDLGEVPQVIMGQKLSANINVWAPQGADYVWQEGIIWLESSGAGSITFYLV